MAPSDMDVSVGESVVLPCQARHDPLLRGTFTWFFNGARAGAGDDGAHFAKVGGVSRATWHPPPAGEGMRVVGVDRGPQSCPDFVFAVTRKGADSPRPTSRNLG